LLQQFSSSDTRVVDYLLYSKQDGATVQMWFQRATCEKRADLVKKPKKKTANIYFRKTKLYGKPVSRK
jgi:ribosome recycling factor